jgi:hypothetical protein
MDKRRGTDNIMVKRRGTDNIMVKRRGTDNIMDKRKRKKDQIIMYKTLHRKLKIEQHETHKNNRE